MKFNAGKLCLAPLLFFSGCALRPKMIAANYVPPQKIAFLPMSNRSNDLKGPEYVRQELARWVEKRGYAILPIAECDEILRTRLGITDGGQLASTPAEKVAEALGVDALMFGDVLEFKFMNIGFYQNRLVEAAFKMVGRDGSPLWEDQRKSSRKQLQTSLKGAGEALARGVAEKAVENIFKVPLYEQVQAVTRMAAATLPKKK